MFSITSCVSSSITSYSEGHDIFHLAKQKQQTNKQTNKQTGNQKKKRKKEKEQKKERKLKLIISGLHGMHLTTLNASKVHL